MSDVLDPDSPDLLLVGYVRKAHGVRGELVVRLTTNREERVEPGTTLLVGDEPRTIATSRPHQGDFLVTFEGVSGRNAADDLRGSELRAAPIDDPDELWVHELIGCRVIDQESVDRGEVLGVIANPASDLLELDTGALVPMRFITEHDGDVIRVDVPVGLFEVFEESGTDDRGDS